jgi:two-component system response regulator FixJ
MPSGSVYLVEDDDAVRASLKALLTIAEWRARDFSSGAEFIEALHDLEPGCVILDMRMEGIDGLGVLQAMADAGIDWPVIVMTGHPDPGIAAAVLKRGAIEFLEKPCREEELFGALDRGFDVLAAQRAA